MLEGRAGQVSVQDAEGGGVHLSTPLHPYDAVGDDCEPRMAGLHHGAGVGRRVVLRLLVGSTRGITEDKRVESKEKGKESC